MNWRAARVRVRVRVSVKLVRMCIGLAWCEYKGCRWGPATSYFVRPYNK